MSNQSNISKNNERNFFCEFQKWQSVTQKTVVAYRPSLTCLIIENSNDTTNPIGYGDNRSIITGIKEAVSGFIRACPGDLPVLAISYSDRAHLLAPLSPVSKTRSTILKNIEKLAPLGKANSTDAFCKALGCLCSKDSPYCKEGYIIRIILLSSHASWHWNGMEILDPDKSWSNKNIHWDDIQIPDFTMVKALKSYGIQIITVGFGEGSDCNSSVLKDFASKSDDNMPLYYHFTKSPSIISFLVDYASFLQVNKGFV